MIPFLTLFFPPLFKPTETTTTETTTITRWVVARTVGNARTAFKIRAVDHVTDAGDGTVFIGLRCGKELRIASTYEKILKVMDIEVATPGETTREP